MKTKNVLLLGSQSPRRKELIEKMHIPFRIVDIPFDEATVKQKDVKELARLKNLAYPFPLNENEILLTADTLVLIEDEILGKPRDEKEAMEMLWKLSGKTHRVETGVCMRGKSRIRCFSEATFLHFKTLTEEEIAYYVQTFSPFDKAGSYGIQEWIGLIGIREIRGSFYNVMGLPTHRVWEEWEKWEKEG